MAWSINWIYYWISDWGVVMNTCQNGCVHVEISDYMLEFAQEEEEKIRQQKGKDNWSTRPLSSRRDILGSLSQNGILDVFQVFGMDGGLQLTPYFSPEMHSDNWDFSYRGETYDIKSSPMRKFKYITHKTTFLVSDHQQMKYVGHYCFAQVDFDNRVIHYPGVISYERFWQESVPAVGDWVKSPAHIITAGKLTPFERIMA